MGKILQQMLGFLLISVLLAFSEGFPQINDRNLRSGNKKENLMIKEIINEVRNKAEAIEQEDKNEDNYVLEIIGAKFKKRNTFNPKIEKVFRTIRGFTEKTIANMLKYYLKNKRRYHETITDNADVILGDSKTNQKMQNNFTAMPVVALAKPASVTKYTGVSKKSEETFGVDTIKMPAPAKSKVDRWLPGLRNYRRRRSFFSDFGFGLESAFENDDTEVVFGAHTSPCDYVDRHYCLNGGTCVFLGALEVKTCR
jgi:hypothetical protein